MSEGESLYQRIGGERTLRKVHKIFYDKIYEHPWLRLFFTHVDQEHIENQQTDFMSKALGGPARYSGRFPVPAHKHMFISTEIFDLRHGILRESLAAAGVCEELMDGWLRIDASFRRSLVKQSVSECEKRFNTDDIVVHAMPVGAKTG